jgi:hypothetical protein
MEVYEYETNTRKIYIEKKGKTEIEIISKVLAKLKLIEKEKKI